MALALALLRNHLKLECLLVLALRDLQNLLRRERLGERGLLVLVVVVEVLRALAPAGVVARHDDVVGEQVERIALLGTVRPLGPFLCGSQENG